MRRWLDAWLSRRWYGQRPVWILLPFTWLFIALTAFRRGLYRVGILLPGVLPAPVIVVGNLNVGGSGKTPCTLWLAQMLQEAGYKPGIITRGYGGNSRSWPRRVAAESDPHEVGDEAVLLARRSGLPVAAGPDRLTSAAMLIEQQQVDVILSDDGLQHYRLPRVAEVIMLDGTRGLGNGWRLPAGPLREPVRRLSQADFVVLKAGETIAIDTPADAVVMRLELTTAVSLSSGSHRQLSEFAGQQVHALAGIADPSQFFSALAGHGLQVDGHALPDHAIPGIRDLVFDDDLPVLMTEKDAVKCRGLLLENHWYIPAVARFSKADAMRFRSGLIESLVKAGP